MQPVQGLHHITAVASDPQTNVDFYRNVLGQRLVKTTVNFDDPHTYHLYYGDEVGTPGTILTFFPWMGMPRGMRGTGETAAVAYSVAPGALGLLGGASRPRWTCTPNRWRSASAPTASASTTRTACASN